MQDFESKIKTMVSLKVFTLDDNPKVYFLIASNSGEGETLLAEFWRQGKSKRIRLKQMLLVLIKGKSYDEVNDTLDEVREFLDRLDEFCEKPKLKGDFEEFEEETVVGTTRSIGFDDILLSM